jgi:hypothetical protein
MTISGQTGPALVKGLIGQSRSLMTSTAVKSGVLGGRCQHSILFEVDLSHS